MKFDSYDGAGDRKRDSTPHRDYSYCPEYTMKKLGGNFPIPVFTPDTDDVSDEFFSCPNLASSERKSCRSESRRTLPKMKTSVDVLTEYFTCPICYDLCIEATTTNCGHRFCKECIDEWKKFKPICPICSTLLTSQHRVYGDDLFVESHLDHFPSCVRERFKTAESSRLDILHKAKNSRNLVTAVRRKFDDSMTYLRCKNPGARLSNHARDSAARLMDSIPTFSSTNQLMYGIVIGIILCLFGSYLFTLNSFPYYLYLAAKNYNGTIPSQWVDSRRSALELPSTENSDAEQMTFVEKFFNSIDLLFGAPNMN